MKKFALLILSAFIATSLAEAAPATTKAKANTTKTKSSTKKASTKKASTKKAKSKDTASGRGKTKTYGIMPSELNELNQNVYHADAEAIKGARDTESALRYLPFVTIVNTAGFGQQFDLRGQGRLSTNGVKFLINGISFNPIDSYYGFMPINTVLPNLIQEVSVYPSLGARGGTINVVTSKRFERPYFQVGAGYANTIATTGTTYHAYAQAAEKFGDLNLNAGVGYFQKGGPREDDSSSGFQGVLGAGFEFSSGQSVFFDIDFYSAKNKTTPYNSLFDSEKINALLAGQTLTLQSNLTLAPQIRAIPSFEPTKDDRKTAGQGEIEASQSRFAGSLGYEGEFNQKLKINITGFYAFDKRKYDTHTSTTLLYEYTNANYSFIGSNDNPNSIDKSGSSFDEQKYGARASIDWKHDNGKLLFGVESIYENAKRNPIQNIQTGKVDVFVNNQSTSSGQAHFIVNINTPLDITQWTNAVFITEKYDITDSFSLLGGGRYQMTKSKITASGEIDAQSWFKIAQTNIDASPQGEKTIAIINDNATIDHGNFAFELAPAFRYSDTGVIYARYEMGFSPVPAYAILQRTGGFSPSSAYDTATGLATVTNFFGSQNFAMARTDLKDETYNSYEIGFKDYVPNREIQIGSFGLVIDALLFSANVFYTDSKNEFYFEGDPYSGLSYNTYDKSRRMGVEVALEQYFFGGVLGLNESFTYLKAEAQGTDGQWRQIPYTYDYKATFGVNAGMSVAKSFNLHLWLQNSFYGNQAVVSSIEGEKLKPYFISDIGLSFGFNKGAIVLTAGVKNVFDTLYYDYYNSNKAASIDEYRYLLGQGRTIFVEGSYKY